jgi:hypothetical protein
MSATDHFGPKFAPLKFDVKTADGKPRHCIGPSYTTSPTECYGVTSVAGLKIDSSELTFCSGCAKSMPDDRVFKFPKPLSFECDTYHINKLMRKGANFRTLETEHFRVGVNATDGADWRPCIKVEDKTKEQHGILTVAVPTMSTFEFSFRGKYNDTERYYYKVTAASSGTGAAKRTIEVTDAGGHKNFYMPLNADADPLLLNSYKKGEVFVFHAPSEQEVSGGLASDTLGDSNKFFFTLEVFEEIVRPQMVFRGGGTTRGGGGTTRGGGGGMTKGKGGFGGYGSSSSPLAAGSTFGMAGDSRETMTTKSANTFERVQGIPQVNIAVHLVSNESTEERHRCARLVQAAIDAKDMPARRSEALGGGAAAAGTTTAADQAALMDTW